VARRSLLVALVTPFVWEVPCAVNHHVAGLARGLLGQGHRPVVLASSDRAAELRRMRSLARRGPESSSSLLGGWTPGQPAHDLLLPLPGSGPLEPEDGIPVIPMGRSFPVRLNGSVANVGLPVDLRSRLEGLLVEGGIDVIHVHEPIAPSLSFTAIREARSPVVSTFHMSPVSLPAYEWEHALLQRFYQALDGRIVTFPHAAHVLEDLIGGDYRVVPPGCGDGDLSSSPHFSSAIYVYKGDDRRGLRAFLKDLAVSPSSELREVVVAVDRASGYKWPPPRRPPRILRTLVRREEFSGDAELLSLLRGSGLAILPYRGSEWLHGLALEAQVAGCSLLAPDLPAARVLLGGGGKDALTLTDTSRTDGGGAVFSPPSRDEELGGVLDAMIVSQRDHPERGIPSGLQTWSEAALRVAEVYEGALEGCGAGVSRAAAHPGSSVLLSKTPGRERVGGSSGWIHVDLHVHSKYSGDSQSSIGDILKTAREVGLGAIAIADHNTVKGALEARALAGEDLTIIVAEEVKTGEGEVMGLFLEEDVPGGLSFKETIVRIKDQGGLVYVPHPFDQLRTTPSYRSMADNAHDLDIIETYNARMAFSSFNLRAERFAEKYGLLAGAGSDAHVLPGLGTAMLHMPGFKGRDDFMASLREADILTNRKSLVYLQSLKLLQHTMGKVSSGS